jgi:hypothetical protein
MKTFVVEVADQLAEPLSKVLKAMENPFPFDPKLGRQEPARQVRVRELQDFELEALEEAAKDHQLDSSFITA